MTQTRSAVAFVLTLVLVTTSSDAAVLCVRRSRRTGVGAEGASLKLRSACKRNEVAVDPVAAGSITTNKVAAGAITAAHIKDGEVVKGGGSMRVNRLTVPDGGTDVEVLTFPSVGTLRASCNAGAATTSFTNDAGMDVDVEVWGVLNGPTDSAFLLRQTPATGGTVSIPNSGTGGIQASTWQVSFTDAGSRTHAATAWVSSGAFLTSCVVTAHALATD